MKKEDSVLVYDTTINLPYFRCPNLIIQIPVFFLISLLLFITLFDFTRLGLLKTLLIFFVPTVISAFILPFLKNTDQQINFRQSSLLAMLSLIIMGGLTLFWSNSDIPPEIVLIMAAGVPFSVRYLIIRAAFSPDWLKPMPHSMIQSLLILPFIQIFFGLEFSHLVTLVAVFIIGFIPIFMTLSFLNKPFLDNFDTSALKLMNIALKLMKGEEEGEKELEKIFKNNSIKADVEYTVFSFRTEEGEKSLFVIPEIHPGPVKGIAGFQLSNILAEDLRSHGTIFTFHGSSTHMLNPIKQKDCHQISKAIDGSVKDIDYDDTGTKYLTYDHGVFIGGQSFDSEVFSTVSFSPRPTEDIEASIGEIVEERARSRGIDELGFVDSHNCVREGCSEVYYPSTRYRRIMNRAEEILDMLEDEEQKKVQMGTAIKKNYDPSRGIGSEGIKVAFFKIGDQLSAQVLIDGNNMIQGLREEIQEDISDIVDISEVHTTDSHEVNTLMNDYNPVGLNMENRTIIEDVRELVERAKEDLEYVEVGAISGKIKNFEVMGPVNSNRLDTISKTLYKVGPFAAALSFVIQALLTSILILII
ncbi:MAG: DUF2070 family protein [Candidatus Thermoplasmatota archaeon]